MICSLCPKTDWFDITHSVGRHLGRGREFNRLVGGGGENLDAYEHLRLPPEKIYLYQDDDHVVIRDVDVMKLNTHYLILPVKHIGQIDEMLEYPELFVKMLSTATKIMKDVPAPEMSLSIAYRPINKPYSMTKFANHFHIKVKVPASISDDLIREILN